jgi:hypothetical protein
MSATYPTKLILVHRSGNKCALPGCNRPLSVDGTDGDAAATGEAAHISGEKPDAARYDPSMTDEQRNHYGNLIYLCGDCHTTIDKLWQDWPLARLLALKANHESVVARAVEFAFTEVAFPELGKAMEWMPGVVPAAGVVDFSLLTPEAKIDKNKLSSGARHVITAGLSSRKVVAEFVAAETQQDPDFPDRLRSGFLAAYHGLRGKGHRNDELFELMCAFAQRGAKTQPQRIAGMAVLVYLFELCDLFEK